MAKFTDVFVDVTKHGHKIPKEDYLQEGAHPIIDQGQEYIAGYSNESDKLYTDVPAIIFGDHTRIIKYVDRPCFLGADGVKLLKAKDANSNYKYLFYALCHAQIPNTGYNRHFKWLKEVEIKLPSKTEQQHIADMLDKLSDLISLRKQQLAKLDELVKARFVEMFGECDLSHPQQTWMAIKEIGTVIGGATPKTNIDEYWGGAYRWITPAEIDEDSGYIYDSVRKLTKAGIDSCSLQEIPIGTVILSSRAPIGKVAIAGNTFYCNQGFKNIVCKDNMLPRFLYTVLLTNVHYLNSLGRGATFKEISKAIVENIQVPVPPIELQTQFSAFIEEIDKSRLTIQQGLDKLEVLKKSLMQQYFG